MGTDIHYWVERRPVGSETWEAVGKEGDYYDSTRNIPLFAALADVRISREWDYAGSKPIAEPRGLPSDLSPEVAAYMGNEWGGNLHSQSWYTLEELRGYEWPENLQFFRRVYVGALLGLAIESAVRDSDIRIVFAFDN